MTIMSTSNKSTQVGNGVTVAFSTEFPFQSNSDVFVTKVLIANGSRTPLVEGVGYTLTGAGTGAAGTVTTLGPGSPLPATYQIEMLRVLPLTQLINLVANDQFDAETVERGLDQGIMIDQQLDARIGVLELVGGSGAALDGANLGGSGVGVFAGKVGNTLNFWKLRAGAGMALTLDVDGIRFDATAGTITPPGGNKQFLRADGVWSNTLGDPASSFTFGAMNFETNSPGPLLRFLDSSRGVDAKRWRWGTVANSFGISTEDDSGASQDDAFQIHRVGAITDAMYLMNGSGGRVVVGITNTEDLTALQVGGGVRAEGSLFLDKLGGGATITGDMSNAAVEKRLSFMTSTLNGATFFTTRPNGTSRVSGIFVHDKTDLSQPGSFCGLYNDGTQTMIRNSTINGGPLLPFKILNGSFVFHADALGNVQIAGDQSTPADLPTNSAIKHFYIPCMNGTPTGAPSAKTGFVPIVYDRAANKLAIYNGGAWKQTPALV